MLPHVAESTEGHEVFQLVVALLTPLDLMMDLEILKRPALPTPPTVPLQHFLHQTTVNLLPQLDPLNLLQHAAVSFDASNLRQPSLIYFPSMPNTVEKKCSSFDIEADSILPHPESPLPRSHFPH
jgi:hypothetical protein